MVTFGDQLLHSSIALRFWTASDSAMHALFATVCHSMPLYATLCPMLKRLWFSNVNETSMRRVWDVYETCMRRACAAMDQLDQETGFIGSQPGMAQFMTGLAPLPALPHINESFQTPSSITGGSGPPVGPPLVPRAAAVQHQQHNRLTPALSSCTSGTDIGPLSVSSASVESPKSGQGSAEFAWMKEKKTTRKQQHSGRLRASQSYCRCWYMCSAAPDGTACARPLPHTTIGLMDCIRLN